MRTSIIDVFPGGLVQLLLNICSLVVFVILHSLREAFNGLSLQDVFQVAGRIKR